MRALVKHTIGKGDMSVCDCPLYIPKPGEVRLRVRGAGICGTDIHIYQGDTSYPYIAPVILGHEVSGEVESLGDGVDDVRIGDPVISKTFYYTCGKCSFCLSGKDKLCPERRSIGSKQDGAFAEYICVPAKNLFHVPPGVSFYEAAMIEPLACCIDAVFNNARIRPGDTVLVSGPGSMGLMVMQLAKLFHAQTAIMGVEKDRKRLDLAEALGADLVVYSDQEDVRAQIKNFAGENGVDIVFECSGAEAAFRMDLEVIRKGGQLIQVGLFAKEFAINFNVLSQKALEYHGIYAHEWYDWDRALTLLKLGMVDVKSLITEVVPLEDWERAFQASIAGDGIKYLIDPSL